MSNTTQCTCAGAGAWSRTGHMISVTRLQGLELTLTAVREGARDLGYGGGGARSEPWPARAARQGSEGGGAVAERAGGAQVRKPTVDRPSPLELCVLARQPAVVTDMLARQPAVAFFFGVSRDDLVRLKAVESAAVTDRKLTLSTGGYRVMIQAQEDLKSEMERQNRLMARLRGESDQSLGSHQTAVKDLERYL